MQLKGLREEFKKTNKEICDAFVKTSGEMNKMR